MSDISFVDVEFLGHPGVIGTGIIPSGKGTWLVDPGPTTALAGLEKGLRDLGVSMADVRGLLLTHIHLDHAGSTGVLVRQRPHLRVFVHERGAPHMIDPSRLLQSAGRLYEGSLERLWGEVAPVPAENVEVLKGGEQLDLDGRAVEVAYTPGHASHHVSFFDAISRVVFAGDTAGVRLGPVRYLVPPTPPPDIDLPAWSSSIGRILEWDPARVYMTHFGAVDQPREHMVELERQLCTFGDMVRTTLDEPGTDEERMKRFVERAAAELRRAMPENDARRYQLAVPLEHCWLGLARYWRKKAA